MSVADDIYEGFEPINERAKNGASFVVANKRTGDFAKAFWAGDMWALYCGPDYETVEQLSFEPTHFRGLQHAS